MLTGDNEKSGRKSSIGTRNSKIIGPNNPQEKLSFIENAQQNGKVVIMAGDGINDLHVGTCRHRHSYGIRGRNQSTNKGYRIATQLDYRAKRGRMIGRKTYKTISSKNIGISILYNAVTIPLAMSGFVIPLVAAISMSFSSILVVLNSTKNKNEA